MKSIVICFPPIQDVKIYFSLPQNAKVYFPSRRLDMDITIKNLTLRTVMQEVFSGIRAGAVARTLMKKAVDVSSGGRPSGKLNTQKSSGVSPVSGIFTNVAVTTSISKLSPKKMEDGVRLGGSTIGIKATTDVYGMGGGLCGERFERPTQKTYLSPGNGVRLGATLGGLEMWRHRRVSEMDTDMLSAFDEMSLRETDYVLSVE